MEIGDKGLLELLLVRSTDSAANEHLTGVFCWEEFDVSSSSFLEVSSIGFKHDSLAETLKKTGALVD